MSRRYPDLIERLLLHAEPLEIPFPAAPSDYAQVLRIRDAADSALAGEQPIRDAAFVPLLRAGLFYYHNDLEGSHALVQAASGDTAAYWHAMIHRREKDFENARYWLRRAGEQPAFAELHARASEGSPNMARQSNWDPFLFVRLAEQFKFGAEELGKEIIHLQRVEFEVMFDYVFRRAVGS